MQATADTLGLAALPPGPGLAAALAGVELSGVPNDRILEVLAAQHGQLCHEQARMAAVIAEVGRCRGYPAPGEVARLTAPEPYASEETRAALRWTRRSAGWEHGLAETVVHGMPGLYAAWLAGAVDRPRVTVFDRFLTGLAAEQVAAICRVAVPRAPRLTTGQLAVLLRRMVLAVDPEAAARWYRKGVRERNVIAVMGHNGTVTMSANGLPADEAEAACVRVQDLAAAAKRAGHPGLIGQIRCDLFLGMLDGRFHAMSTEQIIAMSIAQYRTEGPGCAVARPDGERIDGRRGQSGRGRGAHGPGGGTPGSAGAAQPGRGAQGEGPARHGPDGATGYRGEQVGIEVRVALSTLLGRDSQPGEIPGLGLLPAADTLARVALQRRAQWRFAVTDAGGRPLSEGVTRRRPDTVGAHTVRRDGPPGGIVEIHVPVALLHEMVACGPAVSGAWAAVVADIAGRHDRRDAHLADLARRPGDRLPHPARRRHTEIRDRTCTFPGCRRHAHAAEQDHTRDHAAGGATVRTNIGPLCGHDHDVKHRGGWQLTQPEPGVFDWRSPLGGEYRAQGEFLLPPMPQPCPIDPRDDRPTATVEGPILRPYRPVERPRPPPPTSALPDEPPF